MSDIDTKIKRSQSRKKKIYHKIKMDPRDFNDKLKDKPEYKRIRLDPKNIFEEPEDG